MHCKQLKLGDVWRTCNKIRAAIFRIGINLSEYFKLLDPHKNCLISESQFISVIHGQLGGTIGLSEQEVAELADYFRVPDGRIYYTQLCDVINDSVPKFSENSSIITGLEWEDPLHTNRLSISEERRLNVLITKIASLVNMKKLILRPYFQDYELVSKNNGTVTIAHFARIMAYLGILLSADDFNLLVKKYLKDSYTLNYIAFLHAIDEVVQYLDRNGILDLSGDIMAIFPGRVINAELPKLPRPEIGKIMASKLFGKQNIFHPALEDPKKVEHILTTMSMIQEHVSRNRLRVNTFFKHFDVLNSGRISVDQFHRGLDALALNGKQRFFLSLPDVQAVINQYRDPCDSTRVCWKTFEDDVDHIFTIQELEKNPNVEVEIPQPKDDLVEASKLGGKDWQSVNTQHRSLCEDAVYKVKQKIIHRRILLKPMFKDFDKHNNGHVSRNQMRQALNSNGILLSDEELFALEERFKNDMGFNYVWFLKEVEPKPTDEPLYVSFLEDMKRLNSETPNKPPSRQEKDIVQILAKIKGKVVRERIRVLEFMKDFDRCNEQVISRINFHRGLITCGFELTRNEVETLMEVFASPMRQECVDYRRFAEVVEEAFTQSCLERAPLIVPIQHVPTKDCEKNFLNFDERLVLGVAMQKLSKKPDLKMNLSSVLKDFDKSNCGTVSTTHFLKALTLRGMYNLISNKEFDVICKCFGFERGMRHEVDYRAFMKALDILYATDKYNPF
ncbi:uncharacterized protein LOC109541236 isoform X1 [Dendroctonus ponderosae]|uniref:EF-hand domain-containing protein n=1 Tax=Dendroctonus ponderosae TaxID=77166 RepID=A0AAR5PXC1_DENPD|nr:uncharacterized protein LOC109541236 isoform X1 [Dendroctonus ponderosae]KAH1021753.1 hypothetical protein HUJ04_011238 [Dendroctonus ponderosae]KAH1028468.1 hypothetical protein HUJ05_001823 [Dendroctonus ponderosae]